MFENSADRNLLIGVLAVQMEFVTQDQLIVAMNAWLLDKSASLDAVLRQQSAIEEDTQGLLVGLVDKHIAMHSGSPSASLASVSKSLPIAMGDFSDPELSRTLSLLPRSSDPLMTAAPSVKKGSNAKNMRFRILRAHSEGGLGTVSVARDQELGREVALKEIKEAYADHPESRRRFLVEGEITGCLEHPGIVPVYGLGEYADGRPYYAMRFIRGESLQNAIEHFHGKKGLECGPRQRELELRKLLRRLIDVCNAIEYAHSRGVLHRDLKPDNVMLGKYGETLVVDWGLAKADDQIEINHQNEPPLRLLSGGGTSTTQMGECLGTPAFMSPEQASGRLDLMRATSDVYSLGATLHAILTGKSPITEGNIETVLRRVRNGEFDKPRDRDPRISRALEAVCLKAMALKPADRYSTASEFAADLERWLSDEPVSAFVEPIGKRIARWSRQHRTLVSSFVAGTIASILILSVSLVFLLAANRREHKARDLADSERLRAETNLAVAKQAVSTMLTEVGREELSQVPQLEQIRKKLLTKARTFYDGFLEQRPADETLRFEWAIALRNLAEIDRLVDNHEQATKRYAQAIEELQSLATLHPSNSTYRRQWASVLDDLGQLVKRRDAAGAERIFDKAISLQQRLSSSDTNSDLLQEMARSLYNRGLVRAEQGKLEAARNDVNTAIETLQSIIENPQSSNRSVSKELARCYNNLANISKSMGSTAEAKNQFSIAIALLEDQVSQLPNNRELRNELAIYQNNFANLLRSEGELEQADNASSQAIEKLESLAQPLPALANELANARHSRGVILSQRQMPQQADQQYREAIIILTRLANEFPKVSLYHDRLGNASFQLGTLQFQAGNPNKGISFIQDAIREHRAALKQSPNEPNFQQHLKNDFVGLSLISLSEKEHENVSQTALEFAREFPDDSAAQFDAAQLIARCISLVESGNVTQPQVDQVDLTSTYIGHVVKLLEAAKETGFRDLPKIEESLLESGAFYQLRNVSSVTEVLTQIRTSPAPWDASNEQSKQ